MGDPILINKIKEAVWVAHSLFERSKTAGSTANLSFLHQDKIYISGTGTCFGTLLAEQFSTLDMEGNQIGGAVPSKEYPLHLLMYKSNSEIQAVLHTHSFYSTLWSCYCGESKQALPSYTPYLSMKVGEIGLVPYAKPGSLELIQAFEQAMDGRKGYLLRNHGPVVGDKDMFSAFYGLEEMEESARIAWELRNERVNEII